MQRLQPRSSLPGTAATMLPALGSIAMVRFESLHVMCRVLDARRVWDRVDLLVKPTAGDGQQWVSSERCWLA
jgi:hypothetical protein